MKVAVFGNLKIDNNESTSYIDSFIEIVYPYLLDNQHITLLTGGASGVQKVISNFIKSSEWDIDVVLFKPWSMIWTNLPFNPNLFFYRTKQIIDNADLVIFLNKDSPDTEVSQAVNYATYRKRRIIFKTVTGEPNEELMDDLKDALNNC